ncbi:hypothetical protein AURDEDRAFT_181309 [Auricularia subglabra TFB-10046 SS5]|nr:hypothetical protein AURDEDRAFT_181309 [Auricularia subglabra TFB-10046 SS5]
MAQLSRSETRELKKGKERALMTYYVLGHAPENAKLWENSLLAKIMVTPEKLRALDAPPVSSPNSIAPLPPELGYGLADEEQRLLFHYLPNVAMQHAFATRVGGTSKNMSDEEGAALDNAEMTKVEQLAKIIDLRNAGAREIKAENTRRCVRAFSPPNNPNDTGRPEVIAALATVKIRSLWDLMHQRRFTGETRKALRKLCYARKDILTYLRRVDRDRYDIVLGQLGLEEAAVTGELMV